MLSLFERQFQLLKIPTTDSVLLWIVREFLAVRLVSPLEPSYHPSALRGHACDMLWKGTHMHDSANML